jgi:hypothetical protein
VHRKKIYTQISLITTGSPCPIHQDLSGKDHCAAVGL